MAKKPCSMSERWKGADFYVNNLTFFCIFSFFFIYYYNHCFSMQEQLF